MAKKNDLPISLENELKLLTDRVNAFENSLNKMQSSFPNKSIEEHRTFHEQERNKELDKRRLRRAIYEKTVTSIIWSSIIGFFLVLWKGIITFLKGAL